MSLSGWENCSTGQVFQANSCSCQNELLKKTAAAVPLPTQVFLMVPQLRGNKDLLSACNRAQLYLTPVLGSPCSPTPAVAALGHLGGA